MKPLVFKGSAAALVTPMHPDGSIHTKALEKQIRFQLENGTDALVVSGTTGEAATLTEAEFLHILQISVYTVGGTVPVIAGAGSNCTEHAVRLSRLAENAGADALLHVTPYYNKASQHGLYLHFKACAEATDLPIILYNVPARTGVNIQPETYQLLSEIDNIVAVKEAGGNFSQMARTADLCGDNLTLYSGNDDQITAALALGAKGVISVLANIVPTAVHTLCQSYFDGNVQFADALQMQYLELIENLFSDVNPIPVKQAMDYMGLNAGPCRLPLCEMEPEAKERLLACLKKYGLVEAGVGSVTLSRPPNTLLWKKNP